MPASGSGGRGARTSSSTASSRVHRSRPRVVRRRPHRALLSRADVPEDFEEQLLLGHEMPVQRARGHPGAVGDRDDRRGAIAALLDQLARHRQQPLARREAGRGAHAGSARSTIAAAFTPAGSVP